jgi:hypothetical protein
MMGISWGSLTNKTALSADEGEMSFASLARSLLGTGKNAIFFAGAVRRTAVLARSLLQTTLAVLRIRRIGRRPWLCVHI